MTKTPAIAAAALLALVCALLAGCGGGKSSPPSLTDADLGEMVKISSSDLPWQITLQSDSAKSEQQAAGDFLDSQAWLQNYRRWGRSGGHVASFGVEGSDNTTVETQVESYGSSDGASDAFTALRSFLSSPDAVSTYEAQGFSNVHIDEVDATGIGEQSAGYSIQVVVSSQRFDTFVILFQRGAIVAAASVGAPRGGTVLSDVEAVAKALDGNIQDVLK